MEGAAAVDVPGSLAAGLEVLVAGVGTAPAAEFGSPATGLGVPVARVAGVAGVVVGLLALPALVPPAELLAVFDTCICDSILESNCITFWSNPANFCVPSAPAGAALAPLDAEFAGADGAVVKAMLDPSEFVKVVVVEPFGLFDVAAPFEGPARAGDVWLGGDAVAPCGPLLKMKNSNTSDPSNGALLLGLAAP